MTCITHVTASVKRTRVFIELRSHYLFEDRFGRSGKGNDIGQGRGDLAAIAAGTSWCRCKGSATSMIVSTHLEACCAKRCSEQLRGHDQTVDERLERDRAVLQRLSRTRLRGTCDKRLGRVRIACRWSAVEASITPSPHGSAFASCWSDGYVNEAWSGSCAAEVIARHPRSYEHEDFVFDPLHYLSLLEQKTNALDQAAPLAVWLSEHVIRRSFRRLLEARMGKAGKS